MFWLNISNQFTFVCVFLLVGILFCYLSLHGELLPFLQLHDCDYVPYHRGALNGVSKYSFPES